MKRTPIFLLLMASMIPILGFGQSGTLLLTVTGIDLSLGGEISAGIFIQDHFPKVGQQMLGQVKEASSEIMILRFSEVPMGEYGIAVFQDVDQNKDLNTNLIGFPKEPIGFSNDARIFMGPPSFEDARIQIEDGKTLDLQITLR